MLAELLHRGCNGYEDCLQEDEELSFSDLKEIILTHPEVREIIHETESTAEFKSGENYVEILIGQWLRYRLRDRRDDTGPNQFGEGKAIEESTYWLDPRYPISKIFNPDQTKFIVNPFEALPYEDPNPAAMRRWLTMWQEVTSHPDITYPGHYSFKKITGLHSHIQLRASEILGRKGYDYLTRVPTWYHTAKILEKDGFDYNDPADQGKVMALDARLPQATKADKIKASWLVVRQFLFDLAEREGHTPENMVDDENILRDTDGNLLLYPLNIHKNLWMQKAIQTN